MDQQEVIDIILSARTPEQVTQARQVLREWMKDHPRDFKVLSGGEMLEMLAQAQGLEPLSPTNPTHGGFRINCKTLEETELP